MISPKYLEHYRFSDETPIQFHELFREENTRIDGIIDGEKNVWIWENGTKYVLKVTATLKFLSNRYKEISHDISFPIKFPHL